jgi:hypothetical protein
VVSFKPLALYSQGNNAPVPIVYRRLGGPQSRSGRYGEEKNPFPVPGIDSRYLGRPCLSLVTIPTELSRHCVGEKYSCVRCEFLTAMTMKSTIFSDIMTCNLAEVS